MPEVLEIKSESTVEQATTWVTESDSVRLLLTKDSIGYFASKVVPGLVGLISVPIFIRLLGIEEYGRFSVVYPLLMAFGAAGSGWLAQGILRLHPNEEDTENYIGFQHAVVRGSLLSAIATGLILGCILLISHNSWLRTILAIVLCVCTLEYTVVLANLQARLRPLSVVKRESLRAVTGLACSTILLYLAKGKNFELVLLGLAFGYLAGGVSRTTFSFHGWPKSFLRVNLRRNYLAELWRYGWAVGAWLLLCQMLPVIDRWMIERINGYSKSGIYASLYEVAVRSFSFLLFPLTQAAHPRIMRYWNQGQYLAARKVMKDAIKFQLWIFLPFFTALCVLAYPLSRLILGFRDPQGGRMLALLTVTGFIWQLALLIHKPLEIQRKTKTMLIGLALAVTINLFSNYFAVKKYGYGAAAYVAVITSLSYLIYALMFSRFSNLKLES